MLTQNLILRSSLLITLGLAVGSCQKADPSFNLASSEELFTVSPLLIEAPQKIDVLWVVDNSGSMETSQTNLANNFSSFITNFTQKKYDYRIAVTTTDAYRERFNQSLAYKSLLIKTPDNESFFTPQTQNIEEQFIETIQVGINGSGDERAFQSIESVLNNAENQIFRRPDAYLAIIIVSDEDDFSHNASYSKDGQYADPSLITPQFYRDFLNSYAGENNFSVFSISILDEACRADLNTSYTGRKIAKRYHELVNLTGGVNSSLCSDFGDSLEFIADTIIEKRPPVTSYLLTKVPADDTLKVYIDKQAINEDSVDGFTFESSALTVTLHGSSARLIGEGGIIKISYQPKDPFTN